MFRDDGGCFMRIKIISGRNVPGCVPGVIPAANVICGISNQTAHTSSIVSNSPIWNHTVEFRGASKKENILFIIRDADQILGSLQIPVKEARQGTVNTKFVDMLNQQSPCCISFTVTLEEKSTLSKKRFMLTTRKLKETVLSRFASDPDLLAPQHSTASLDRNEHIRKSGSRSIQRCHSYVNERSRASNLSRHQYVNCSKQRTCGELGRTVDLASIRERHLKNTENNKKLLVLIQGRNLGTSQSDVLSVNVGGVDCTQNIQHFSSEKILVRLPRGAQLSPVSVVTKSGGVGQQNAKVKVTFESASSSDEIKSLRRAGSQSETGGSQSETGGSQGSPVSPHKPPRSAIRTRHARNSTVYSTTSSDSGSDGMCVNTKTSQLPFVPPPRKVKRSSSFSSFKSSVEPDSLSTVSVEVTPPPRDSTPRQGGKLGIVPPHRAIVPPHPARDIIAPPEPFSEGATPIPHNPSGDEDLYDLTKSELVEEIMRLRGTVSNLTKSANNLSIAS